jgi:AAHS family 4-hydroxybenzoate transporter-like MFS transporter
MVSSESGSMADVAAAPAGGRGLTALQWRVVSLCALVAFLDGFDTQAIGPAARTIAGALHVPMGAFGLVFSASQVGFLIGAMAFSALGDRFGRKRLLIAATAAFAVCSLGTALAGSFPMLIAFRFLAGLGLGGASPNFVSLASEYAPAPRRVGIVTMLWAAVPLGGMASAFASSAALPSLGWRAVFFAGCAAPLLLVFALARLLPESRELVRAHAASRGDAPRVTPIVELFSGGRAHATILLWLASFMTWTALIVMAFWTPPLLQKAGQSAAGAAQILALNNAGGVAGTVLLGALLTRVRPRYALPAALVLAGLFVGSIGYALTTPALLATAACFAGFFASAAAGALLAVSAETYPADARSTGVGWALGFGRVGAVIGPVAAGLLVARDWPVRQLYLAIAAPFLAAAALVILLALTAPAKHDPTPSTL